MTFTVKELKSPLLALITNFASHGNALATENSSAFKCTHTVSKGETLSDILLARGIEPPHFLYGDDGWVARNKRLNPDVKDWHRLESYTKLNLEFPFPVPMDCKVDSKTDEKTQESPIQQEIKAEPTIPDPPTADLPMESNIPSSELPPAPSPSSPVVEIPPTQETTHDSDLNLMGTLTDLASSAIDIRYGKSMAPEAESLLIPKMTQFSIVYESKFEAFQKIRIYFDTNPKVTDTYLDQEYSIQSSRLVIGRAFLFDLPERALFELTPKIGYWRYYSIMPLDTADDINAVKLDFTQQLVLGGDLGISRRFGLWTPRIWYGRDLTTSLFKGNKDSAGGVTYRTAFEARYDLAKLPQITDKSSYYVVGYAMQETTRIANGSKMTSASDIGNTAGQQNLDDADNESEVIYSVNYLGLGIGLSW